MQEYKSTIQKVHGALTGKLLFINYPTYPAQTTRYKTLAESLEQPPEAPSVLVTQVPHRMPVEVVAWAVDMLLRKYSVQRIRLERATGHMKVWVTNSEDQGQLLEFNNSVMFDLPGIWCVDFTGSKTDQQAQREVLAEYCAPFASGAPAPDARLPKSSMTITDPKAKKDVALDLSLVGAHVQQLTQPEDAGSEEEYD